MNAAATSIDRLIIFAKYPRAGTVKTRLAPTLGSEGAAELYRAFLLDAVELWSHEGMHQTCVSIADENDIEPMRALFRDELTEAIAAQTPIVAQRGGDLGARLVNALRDAFSDGCRRVCLIGSDHPTLPHSMIAELFDRTSACDVAIGATDDGGYWAIAMDAVHDALFDGMPFSTPALFDQTMRRASDLGLSVRCGRRWYDVDDVNDFERLRVDRHLLGKRSRTIVEAISSRGAREIPELAA